MTRFEQIGVQHQLDAYTLEEAAFAFKISCALCCNKGINIQCSRCCISSTHDMVAAAFEYEAAAKRTPCVYSTAPDMPSPENPCEPPEKDEAFAPDTPEKQEASAPNPPDKNEPNAPDHPAC